MTAGAGLDGGSCCADTKANFNTNAGIPTIGAAGTFSTTAVNGVAG